ncbi:MAG: TonB-dependent receptor [Ignavibacteria bacterium]|jgi:outer membrane receptor for ferrienterochelin and colicins
MARFLFCFLIVSLTASILSPCFPQPDQSINRTDSITGRVFNTEKQPLYGVNVYIPELQNGAQTNFKGKFEITNIPNYLKSVEIHFSYIGYKKVIKNINLPQNVELNVTLEIDPVQTDEVVVTENREGVFLKNSPVKIEVITTRQIEKNYSIDLTQAFQFTPGVKVQNNCGVCSTSDLRILGLEGQYSQILIDGHPIVSNLGAVYGLMGINTSNIKQIEIVKGPGSILYGPESVSGTINVLLKDPSDRPPYSVRFEGTTHLEHAFALSGSKKWDKTATSIIFDYAGNYNRLDENGDGFTDVPVFERYSIINQWLTHLSDKTLLKVFGRYYYEDRFGGQINWDKSLHRGGTEQYGESIYTNRGELFGKFSSDFSQSFQLQSNFSGVIHSQNSAYGNTIYNADQFTTYFDLVGIKSLNESNSITFGTAYKFDRYDDDSPATNNPANSHIVSLFAQDEITFDSKIITLLGLRYNYHNIQKSIWQPRASIKYSPFPLTNVRLSFGTGFRTVNLFTEDHASLIGTRTLEIAESLEPEKSINTTLSFVQSVDLITQFLQFQLSGHYTRFSNQIIPDYDTDVNKIIYSNLDGYSISKGMETSIAYENFLFPLRIFISYEFLETFKVEDGLRNEIEFNPKHIINTQIDYIFRGIDLELTVTGKWVGKQKLPLLLEPEPRPIISEPYSIWNVVFRKELKDFTFTFGMNNVFNYTQPSPINDPEHPFGDYFDTSYIYGPLHGRELITTVQIKIN